MFYDLIYKTFSMIILLIACVKLYMMVSRFQYYQETNCYFDINIGKYDALINGTYNTHDNVTHSFYTVLKNPANYYAYSMKPYMNYTHLTKCWYQVHNSHNVTFMNIGDIHNIQSKHLIYYFIIATIFSLL